MIVFLSLYGVYYANHVSLFSFYYTQLNNFFISASFSKGQESKFDYLSARYLKKYENLIEKSQQAQ